jgi:hypothetical protein
MSKNPGKTYGSAENFRQALEQRLHTISREERIPLEHLRKHVAFDRLLARLFDRKTYPVPQWLLKGGYALEMRYSTIARATKDIDIGVPKAAGSSPEAMRGLLQNASTKDANDWFSFLIGMQSQELQLPLYGGWRFPVEARVANRTFTKFHIDVAVGDEVASDAEWHKGRELLGFAGIPAAEAALFPRERQFADKIHSYTYPRDEQERSRVKDLIDLALLIENGMPATQTTANAVTAVFQKIQSHSLPDRLPAPPGSWEPLYKKMALDCGVTHKTVHEAFGYVSSYWETLFNKGE